MGALYCVNATHRHIRIYTVQFRLPLLVVIFFLTHSHLFHSIKVYGFFFVHAAIASSLSCFHYLRYGCFFESPFRLGVNFFLSLSLAQLAQAADIPVAVFFHTSQFTTQNRVYIFVIMMMVMACIRYVCTWLYCVCS